MTRLALTTCAALPDLAADDRPLQRWLHDAGVPTAPVIWNDASVDWQAYDAVLIRSPWDYHLQPAAFCAWIDRVEAVGTPLFNAAPLLRWNLDKRYLRELEAHGAHVVPTVWLDAPGDGLQAVLQRQGWPRAVVKPTISATAHRTWVTTPARADEHQAEVDSLLADGGVMVQQFRQEVIDEGEWSCMYFAGRFSHAVLKKARRGDFRVQEEFEGTVESGTPPPALRAQADRVLEFFAGTPPLYARVDGVRAGDQLLLMELEIIEPSLYLAHDPNAVERFGAALLHALGSAARG